LPGPGGTGGAYYILNFQACVHTGIDRPPEAMGLGVRTVDFKGQPGLGGIAAKALSNSSPNVSSRQGESRRTTARSWRLCGSPSAMACI